MQYTTPNGTTVELPKLTVALARKMNANKQATAPEDAWRCEYAFLRDCLPPECLSDALDGDTFEAIDLSALDALFAGVVRAYSAPALEAQAGRASDVIGSLDMDKLGKVADLLRSVERMQQMQQPRKGFRAVR